MSRTITTMAATMMPAIPSGGMELSPGKSGDISTVEDDASMFLDKRTDEAGMMSLVDAAVVENNAFVGVLVLV